MQSICALPIELIVYKITVYVGISVITCSVHVWIVALPFSDVRSGKDLLTTDALA